MAKGPDEAIRDISIFECQTGIRPPITDHRIGRVLELLAKEPQQTVGVIAQSLNLSTSRLEHVFKAEMGRSLKAHRAECRLRRAAELLKSTLLGIKEITRIVGYTHTSNLTRAFTRRFGITPRQYRPHRVANKQRIMIRV